MTTSLLDTLLGPSASGGLASDRMSQGLGPEAEVQGVEVRRVWGPVVLSAPGDHTITNLGGKEGAVGAVGRGAVLLEPEMPPCGSALDDRPEIVLEHSKLVRPHFPGTSGPGGLARPQCPPRP